MTPKEQISKFLQKDTIWELFDVESQEDFIDRFVTKGRFHKNVPEIIQKDYKLVEQIQFYSYYNYSLIDEAFGKSTRIFEASVNLKITDIGIEKDGFESLHSKIKRLEKHFSIELMEQWLLLKELRNRFAHHEAGRLLGVTLLRSFKHIVNMINSVFLSQLEVMDKENTFKRISSKSEHLKKGLFIMEYNRKRYLIWSMIPYTASENNGIEKSFWVFHPVYRENQVKRISDFPSPFMLNLKDLVINENGLSAVVIESNESITINATDINENFVQYERHIEQMIKINLDLKEKYWKLLEIELNNGVIEFIYNHSWK